MSSHKTCTPLGQFCDHSPLKVMPSKKWIKRRNLLRVECLQLRCHIFSCTFIQLKLVKVGVHNNFILNSYITGW